VLPFNFNHLYYFYVIATQGSFSLAARVLMVSQSSLSVQMKQFESALGHRLFDRRKTGVELTESGEVLFQYAEGVFHDVDGVRDALEAMQHKIRGTLSISTVNSIGIYILPDILKDFREIYPEIKFEIDFRSHREVVDTVRGGKAHFAILTTSRSYSGLTSVPLRKIKMFVVAPPKHPLAGREEVSPRDIEEYPFVAYEEGMETRMMMDALFKRMGLRIEYALESSNVATIKHMVMAGLGISILPEPAVTTEIHQRTLMRLPIPSLFLAQEITLYHKTNRTLTPTKREFLKFIQKELGTAGITKR
jgi:DNA-binding transcriptional LysR family regulator